MSASRRRVNHHDHHINTDLHNRNQTDELTNIRKSHTQDGVGGGSKLGVMTDSIASSNNDIKNNSTLMASRLNNIQNYITADGAGGGNKLGEIAEALNTNVISSLGKLDTIATNTANIHIDVESVNLNVDTLEALQTSTKNALFENTDGTGLTGGQNLSALNANAITRNSKLDTIIANTAASATTGLASETTLAAAEVHLGNIETAVQLLDNIVSGSEAQVDIVSSALPTGAATESTLANAETHLGNIETAVQLLDDAVGTDGSAGPSKCLSVGATESGGNIQELRCDSDGHLQVDIVSGGGGDATEATLAAAEAHLGNIETAVQLLDNIVSGSEAQVDIVSSALPTGAATESTLAAAETHLGNIETAVQLLDDAVGTDGSTGPSKCLSIGATESGGNIQELLCDGNGRLSIDVNSAPTTAVTNSTLTSLANAINSNRVDVNIANGGFSGAVTNSGTFAVQVDGDALTSLQLIDDVVKAEDSAHSNGDKGVALLAVRKDTQTQLAGSDADYGILQTNASGALRTHNNRTFSSETSYISGQTVSGSGTHTGSTVTNDPNTERYIFEHNFSGSDVAYEVEESIDNSNFFSSGNQINAPGDPSAALTGLNSITVAAPFFRIKFTNSNGSSRDVNLSFVSLTLT